VGERRRQPRHDAPLLIGRDHKGRQALPTPLLLHSGDLAPDRGDIAALHIARRDEHACDGAPFKQGLELVDVAIADHDVAPEPLEQSRIGAQHLISRPPELRLKAQHADDADRGQRQRCRRQRAIAARGSPS
jgi:hypothetical protein